jgi:hypothetical protein
MKNTLKRIFAPYRVDFQPHNLFEQPQTIYAFTLSDAIDWSRFAFNSDQVVISNRINDSVVAIRHSI